MQALMPRTDIQPVILGGDWSSYAIAREFFEAFAVSTYCVAPGAVAVIAKSRFMDVYPVSHLDQSCTLDALRDIARRHASQTVVLMANTDDRVEIVESIADDLPDNVIFQFPPHELASMVSDKVRFQELCRKYGLDTPRTEVVSLAGEEPIAPTLVPFPLVAKPAVSSQYAPLFARGFQKVYFVQAQEELDRLWADLRAAGFSGDFLVQELIGGDDTYMDSISMYVNSAGKVAVRAGAHVLLEDHVPALFGNPVAMITKPMDELWDKLGKMLTDIGWRGFANIDLKRDPRDGRKVFMDFNPRIGANSYYVCAGGANPMYVLVRDIVDGVTDDDFVVRKNVLYKRIPVSLLRDYVLDPDLRDKLDEVVALGKVVNPTRCRQDTFLSQANGALMEMNYIRKFRTYYPKPTQTSF